MLTRCLNSQVLRVAQPHQQAPFVQYGVDGLFGDNALFAHFLHGELVGGLLVLHPPHTAEATLADHEQREERVLGYNCELGTENTMAQTAGTQV